MSIALGIAFLSWLTEMTQIRKIDSLLYFKGIIDKTKVLVNSINENKYKENDFKIVVSIIN